jgi:YD repeat-containing protein
MDSLKYKYDAVGNITEILENGMPIARYEYDALGRITREDIFS